MDVYLLVKTRSGLAHEREFATRMTVQANFLFTLLSLMVTQPTW